MHRNQEEYGHRHSHDELEIYDYMILEDATRKSSIPIVKLTNALNIPLISSSKKIAPLKKIYGFEMEELKDAIIKLKDKN